MENFKNWVDGFVSVMIMTVLGFFTWLDIRLPHITMWLSFFSMLLSVGWWIHRYWHALKDKKIIESP